MEVNMGAIGGNFAEIRKKCGCAVFPVVKANAYGHGAVPVAHLLEKQGAAGFAVSNIQEAVQLREAGIQSEILILGYTPAEYARQLSSLRISQCVFSVDYARELSDYAKKQQVVVETHLKLDTGMGRIGFDCRTDALKGLEEAESVLFLPNLEFTGVMTHFSVADSDSAEDTAFTREQYSRFFEGVRMLERRTAHTFRWKHCNNSAAIWNRLGDDGNAVRAGIILYGLAPSQQVTVAPELVPAMSLYSVVTMVKELQPGDFVGYGRTYQSRTPRRIATVAAGYADGVPRLLSNCGRVRVRDAYAPIVGNVCMDQLCIDVTDLPQVQPGDAVTIWGKGLPVEEVAGYAKTINYEIICGVTQRVPRVYVNE